MPPITPLAVPAAQGVHDDAWVTESSPALHSEHTLLKVSFEYEPRGQLLQNGLPGVEATRPGPHGTHCVRSVLDV